MAPHSIELIFSKIRKQCLKRIHYQEGITPSKACCNNLFSECGSGLGEASFSEETRETLYVLS